MNNMKQKLLNRFGFSFEKGGAHLSRTLMLSELKQLLSYTDNPTVKKEECFHAIKSDLKKINSMIYNLLEIYPIQTKTYILITS
ncbi:MAG: hypothetical protein HOD92_07035 [Deltaproteobacteria bacterium]|nr:hypothetical protein [Deltaproteobacteria bacterium]